MQPIPDHPTCPPALLGSCSLMEQKTDWLKGSTGEIIRRLKDREDTALTYKRWRTVQMVYVAGAPLMCMYWSCCWDDARSLMEHKVDQMTANLTNRHLEREESAQQIKRYLGWMCRCAGFYCSMWVFIVLDAGWWTRRLTRWQLSSPEDSWRERIQLSRLRGMYVLG